MSRREDFDPNHARVLVVGSMFAGKTSLVHSLCHCSSTGGRGAILQRPTPTVGCNVEVKMLAGRFADRFIEFWDIGGNPDAAPARGMFFEDSAMIAGVLLVYDVSNPRSLRELRTWASELSSAGVSMSFATTSNGGVGGGKKEDARGGEAGRSEHVMSENSQHRERREFMMDAAGDLEGGPGGAFRGKTPVLVVGNKADLCGGGGGVRCMGAALAEELGAAHVTVSDRQLDQEPFERFFEEVFRSHAGLQTPREEGAAHSAWALVDSNGEQQDQVSYYIGGGRGGAGAGTGVGSGSGYGDIDAWHSASARTPRAMPSFPFSSSATAKAAAFDNCSDRKRAGHGVAPAPGRRVVPGQDPGLSTSLDRDNVLEASTSKAGEGWGRAGSGGFHGRSGVADRVSEGRGGGVKGRHGDALGQVWSAQRGASAGGVRSRREKQC